MNKKNNKTQKHKNYGKYINLPFQMVAIIAIGVVGGIKLDAVFKTKFPFCTLILTITSVSLAIYTAIKDLIK